MTALSDLLETHGFDRLQAHNAEPDVESFWHPRTVDDETFGGVCVSVFPDGVVMVETHGPASIDHDVEHSTLWNASSPLTLVFDQILTAAGAHDLDERTARIEQLLEQALAERTVA